MRNSASIVYMAAKRARVSTTFECSLCKADCWNSHLIAGSSKKRRQEKKKTVIKIMYSQKEN